MSLTLDRLCINNAGYYTSIWYAVQDEYLHFLFHLAFSPIMMWQIKHPVMVWQIKHPVMVGILKSAIHYPGFQIHPITLPAQLEQDLFPLSFCISDWAHSLQPIHITDLFHSLNHFSIY
jgi:hypothetical protein